MSDQHSHDGQPRREVELHHAAAMPVPQGGALPTSLEWQALDHMAHTLAGSSVIPWRLKGKPADVAVVLLAAREYGIPPLMALSKLPVVNGTPAPMGELMVALVLRAGHRIGARFLNPDGTVYAGGPLTLEHYGEARYRRRDWTDDEVLRFTIAEAVQAGLVTITRDGKPNARDDKNRPTPWELYTPNMARWRAVANAARLAFPDVLLGLSHLPEELGAVVDAEGAPVEAQVVGPRGAAPTGSLEQRTAQEAADKLAAQPWPDVTLDAVREHAAANGYLTAPVSYAGGMMTLEEALARHVEDRQHADTVDADVVEDQPHAETTREDAAEAPTAPEQPQQAPEARPVVESPQEAALDLAREALNTSDEELLRTLYRGAGDLKGLDVLPVIGDDDLAALDAPSNLADLPLGTLLMRVADYVKRHGTAVRDLGQPDQAPAAPGPDPWAEDQRQPDAFTDATGWPPVAGQQH